MRSAKVINLANANLSKVSGKSLQKDQGAVKHSKATAQMQRMYAGATVFHDTTLQPTFRKTTRHSMRNAEQKHLRTKRAAVACDATVTVLSSCACPMASSSDCASCTVSEP
jgi:hypothetical protein